MPSINIRSVANQRIIVVKKAPADKEHLYSIINLQALNKAVKNIKSIGGIKLYFYCATNQNGYTFALSRQHFMEWAGCAETAYNTGVAELIEKGYLSRQGESNYYTFFEDTTYRNN